MSAKTLVSNLRDEIDVLQNQRAQETIRCSDLIPILDEIITSPEAEPDPVWLEQVRAHLQASVEDRKALQASNIEMFRSVITAGQNALRTALLINGGATIALLAFLGKLTTENPSQLALFSGSLMIFTIGVLISGLSSGFAYLSQWLYASETPRARNAGWILNIICIILGLSAYGMFLLGAIDAYSGFQNFK